MEVFTGGPDPRHVTVTVLGERREGDEVAVRVSLVDDTDSEGGELTVRVSGSADTAYGLTACVEELERWINQLPEENRLAVVLVMGKSRPFRVNTFPEVGPRVIAP
jgi:hypothetical protein